MFGRGLANEFARDVRAGLTRTEQKTLPCRYLYDEVGSALFEAITCLPEYGLTRADTRVLRGARGRSGGIAAAECGGGGTGQRQRSEDAAGSGADPPAADRGLLSHRFVAGRAGAVRGGTGGDGGGGSGGGELPGRPAAGGGAAGAAPDAAGAVSGKHHREFRAGSGHRFSAGRTAGVAARRRAAAGHRPGEAGGADDSGVRRRGGRDGGVQPEPAGAHQPRTGRRFQPAAVPARGALHRRRRSASRCTCARWSTRLRASAAPI